MTNNRSLRYASLLATLLLAFGLVMRGQAQTSSNIATLDDAYATLAQADHDYKGHRAKAMVQIKQAVKELGGSISGHGKGHGRRLRPTPNSRPRRDSSSKPAPDSPVKRSNM